MAVRVRVKNFQSIEDAEIWIDGFVVITGPNNSGKTAFFRAIRGVFTNPSVGPLLRTGTAYLSVEMEFEDGTHILWEKGWEKPGQKGASINRYTLNGVTLESVGRGVPSEIEALGVQQITAASDKIWPQIADQFDGTLFLVNRPGSSVAEALSDVAKVGRLTGALKLSEKDRRANDAELKVRRKDLITIQEDVDSFDGLDGVAQEIRGLAQDGAALAVSEKEIEALQVLQSRFSEYTTVAQSLQDFDPTVLPSASTALQIQEKRREVGNLQALALRHSDAATEAASLSDFKVSLPVETRAIKLQKALVLCQGFSTRLARTQTEVERLSGDLPLIPSSNESTRLKDSLAELQAARTRLTLSQTQSEQWAEKLVVATEQLDLISAQVEELLGERGECPTCGTVCQGHAQAGASA